MSRRGWQAARGARRGRRAAQPRRGDWRGGRNPSAEAGASRGRGGRAAGRGLRGGRAGAGPFTARSPGFEIRARVRPEQSEQARRAQAPPLPGFPAGVGPAVGCRPEKGLTTTLQPLV